MWPPSFLCGVRKDLHPAPGVPESCLEHPAPPRPLAGLALDPSQGRVASTSVSGRNVAATRSTVTHPSAREADEVRVNLQ